MARQHPAKKREMFWFQALKEINCETTGIVNNALTRKLCLHLFSWQLVLALLEGHHSKLEGSPPVHSLPIPLGGTFWFAASLFCWWYAAPDSSEKLLQRNELGRGLELSKWCWPGAPTGGRGQAPGCSASCSCSLAFVTNPLHTTMSCRVAQFATNSCELNFNPIVMQILGYSPLLRTWTYFF